MPKEIHFDIEAREGLRRGVNALSAAVAATLGPKGRNVLLDKSFGGPKATKDGVSVAREIEFEDRLENMGAALVKEVASKTNDVAGDGTTTATVLASSIFNAGMKSVAAGINPIALKRGLDRGCRLSVEELKKLSRPVEGDDIERVASISANDPELGKLIAETIGEVGKSGVITVEESRTIGVEKETVDGMRFDRGYVSPYMCSDAEKMEAHLEEGVTVIVTDEKVSAATDLIPLIESVLKAGRKDILLVADDVTGDALTTLVVNKMRGTLNVVAVKAPGFGDFRKEMLLDIATLTGAKLISRDLGSSLKDATVDDTGTARRVVVTKEHTTIVDGGGSSEAIAERAETVRKAVDDTDSSFDRERLTKRLASLTGGVGVIKVGMATETETKETVQRVEDALAATKAAVEEGIVPGGGTALVRAAESLPKGDTEDERAAMDILREAMAGPLCRIASNAGKDGRVVLARVRDGLDTPGFGYDAAKDEYCDLLAGGIVDPTKVTRSALQNAVSIASLLLTTEAAVVDIPKKEEQVPPGM